MKRCDRQCVVELVEIVIDLTSVCSASQKAKTDCPGHLHKMFMISTRAVWREVRGETAAPIWSNHLWSAIASDRVHDARRLNRQRHGAVARKHAGVLDVLAAVPNSKQSALRTSQFHGLPLEGVDRSTVLSQWRPLPDS